MDINLLLPLKSIDNSTEKEESLMKIRMKHQILQHCSLYTFNLYDEPMDKFIFFQNEPFYYMRHALNFTLDNLKQVNIKIAKDYLKICSFAFLFGIGKNCFFDLKYNKLIMVDVSNQRVENIIDNILDFFTPKDILDVVHDVYANLNKLQKYNLIPQDVKTCMIDIFEKQLLSDIFN